MIYTKLSEMTTQLSKMSRAETTMPVSAPVATNTAIECTLQRIKNQLFEGVEPFFNLNKVIMIFITINNINYAPNELLLNSYNVDFMFSHDYSKRKTTLSLSPSRA